MSHRSEDLRQWGDVRFIECKSYQETTDLSSAGVAQLIEYLADPRVSTLNNLLYVFNAQKISDQQAKEKMQTVFRLNAPKFYLPVTQGGVGAAKMLQLFGVDNEADFLRLIVPDMSTYNFVTTN